MWEGGMREVDAKRMGVNQVISLNWEVRGREIFC